MLEAITPASEFSEAEISAIAKYRKNFPSEKFTDQTCLGSCYFNGYFGIGKNITRAFELFQEAEKLGDARAIRNIGGYYEMGMLSEPNLELAFIQYKTASSLGDSEAKLNLALCYFNGIGVEQNKDAAARIFEEVAISGDASSKRKIATYYERGIYGFAKDADEAVKLYNKAATLGDVEAITSLGVCYEKGEGVESDIPKAVKLYEKASALGDVRAKRNLAILYYEGSEESPEMLGKAIKEFQQAAELGDAISKVNLGICYQSGLGVTKDEERAVELYKEAVELGNAKANLCLASCYELGKGVEENILLSAFYYSEAFRINPKFNHIINKDSADSYRFSLAGLPTLPKHQCLSVKHIIRIIDNLRGNRINEDSSTFIYDITNASSDLLSLEDMREINQKLVTVPRIDINKNSSIKKIVELIKQKEVSVVVRSSKKTGDSLDHLRDPLLPDVSVIDVGVGDVRGGAGGYVPPSIPTSIPRRPVKSEEPIRGAGEFRE